MDEHPAMNPVATAAVRLFRPPGFGVICRLKLRDVSNRVRQAARETPLKLGATLVFVLLIWLTLFLFFSTVFDRIYQTSLEGVVAVPMVFKFFFVALMVMLTFSNAILAHGSLFGWGESAYLFASPVRPSHVVAVKYAEGLVFSSWSLILLGIPLMVAMASRSEGWAFYPIFVAFFLCFVPIPAAVGLFAAWAVAMWAPRSGRRLIVALAVLIGALALTWIWQVWQSTTHSQGNWIKHFYSRMALIESNLWPSTWVTRGIYAAANRRLGEAAFYLYLTFANAVFFSYAVVKLVGSRAVLAFSLAQAAGAAVMVRGGRATRWLAALLFFYLPRRLRLVALKDVRTFSRDPLQWSQLAILFGLMTIYIVNIPQINGVDGFIANRLLISYLNFAAMCLILATFTSRFVFPMISLEGYQLWLIGLLPLPRGWLLGAKLAFALTVTWGCAVSVMSLASWMLELPLHWALMHLAVMASVCAGLSGLAVGLGARFPVFSQRNPTRIASGFGGTINLIFSVVYIIAVLVAVGWVTFRLHQRETPVLDVAGFAALTCTALLGLAVAAAALLVGARYFRRLEV